MKRILIGLVIGLALLEAARRLDRPGDEAAAAGYAAYGVGDFARAEAEFRRAEQAAGQPALAAHNHAAALYRLGRFEDADPAYEHSDDGEALHAARAAYDRGNCAFREGCADEDAADPELLERAARQYEGCLAREGSTADAGSLFDDARHNLELARLILAEFAESTKDPSREERDDAAHPTRAQDDPFSPANDAHAPEPEAKQQPPDGGKNPGQERQEQKPPADANKGETNPGQQGQEQKPPADANRGEKNPAEQGQEQKPPDGANKGEKNESPSAAQKQPAEEGQKPSDPKAKSEQKEQEVRECKECKRGGCPKCKKKPGKGPGPLESPQNVQGPKPNPGKADNGKAPGPAKSPNEANHAGGANKQGKPGDGGKPNPNGKNGVGEAKEPGTGTADPGSKPGQKKSEGKMVGPDGVTFERQDKPGGGDSPGAADRSDSAKPGDSGGKDAPPNGTSGEGGKPRDAANAPKPSQVEKLFRPGTPRPNERHDPNGGGAISGRGNNGLDRSGAESDETDGNGDAVDRAAARRLHQAVQRIQKARESRSPVPGPGKGDPPPSDRRRDW